MAAGITNLIKFLPILSSVGTWQVQTFKVCEGVVLHRLNRKPVGARRMREPYIALQQQGMALQTRARPRRSRVRESGGAIATSQAQRST